jgi:hypothetical protein
MKIKNKIALAAVLAGMIFSAQSAYASEAEKKDLFTPCQYKGTYKYYMERGEGYLSDNQYESAIESFERALIVQPNSQDARSKIVFAKESLLGKKTPERFSDGKRSAQTVSYAEYAGKKKAGSGARPAVIYEHSDEPGTDTKKSSSMRRRAVTAVEPVRQAPSEQRRYSYQKPKVLPERYHQEKAVEEYQKPVVNSADISKKPIYKEPALKQYEKPSTKKYHEPEEERSKSSMRRMIAKASDEEVYSAREIDYSSVEPEKNIDYPAYGVEKLQKTQETIQEPKKPSAREILPSIAPEPETEKMPSSLSARVSKPELVQKYPSAIVPLKASLPEARIAPALECKLPFFQDFSDGFNSKVQQGTDNINSNIAPAVIRGEYRVAFGATEDDVIWKDASADYHNMPGDTSWRYLYGKDKHNSYDKAIYSRLKVDMDAHFTDTISGFGQMVIDPWTFVGKKRVYATGSNGDNVQMDYKYWSNTRSTINETYRTALGDIVNVNENKVKDGKTSSAHYTGLSDWGANAFDIPEVEIDRMYVPIRKLWVEYDREPYSAKVFAMAGQEEALTSDDPMRLSNNKVWWEESPWLDRYDASRAFDRSGNPIKKGQWVRNLSFAARDSEDNRLTFLRGASFNADFNNGASIRATAAAPRNLWDNYEQASSIPAALQMRTPVTDRLTIGGLYTFKGGIYKQSLEASNNLGAVDGTYQLSDNTGLFGQFAASNMKVDEARGYKNDYTGYAGSLGLKNQGAINFTESPSDRYELKAMFASMNDRFYPGLSNYRFTRREFEFAKHIYFEPMNPENEAMMFGDGIDIGRNAFSTNLKAEFPDTGFDAKLDFRTVYSDSNNHIEDVYRFEGTYKATDKLTLKGLAFYKYLPKTKEGIDPLINAKGSYSAFTDYFAYDDVWLKNDTVKAGKDPSIGAFSSGLKYDFTDYFSGEGVYEYTNDPKDYPRGLLNNVYVDNEFRDNVYWDKIVPFLYSQDSFGAPPYKYYNIYKTRFVYYPFEPLKITLKYTYNENKYAMAIDDNPTAHGIEFEYKPCTRTTLGFLYQYTRQRDLYKQIVMNEGYNFDGHHNIFASFDYKINQDQSLRLMYGAYVGYDYDYPEEHDDINALDTRHIVRFSYTGKFGPSGKQGNESLVDSKFNALGPLNPAIPGASFVTKLSGGWAKYKQKADIAPVESDWDSYLLRLDLGMDAYDREYWEGGINLGLFTTIPDNEKWEYNGAVTYQTDDMYLRGADVNADIGWAFSNSTKYISVTPLITAGYRRVEFTRGKIALTSTSVPQLGETNENFNITYAGIGGRVDAGPVNNMNFFAKGYYAPLIYAPINNSALGRVTCDRGSVVHAEGGIDYAVSDRFDLSFGGFWDKQHLKKANRTDNNIVNFEMPDNKLETYGLTLGGQYRF